MTNQEQIDEMANDIAKCFPDKDLCFDKNMNCVSCIAMELYNAGYRKVPENSVVLTGEEYSDYLLMHNNYEHAVEKLSKLQEDNEMLYRNLGKFKQLVTNSIAKEIFNDIFRIIFIQYVDEIGRIEKYIDSDLFVKDLRELAKKYGVEEEE